MRLSEGLLKNPPPLLYHQLLNFAYNSLRDPETKGMNFKRHRLTLLKTKKSLINDYYTFISKTDNYSNYMYEREFQKF